MLLKGGIPECHAAILSAPCINPYAGPPRVLIRTCRTDNDSVIVVEDNGPGFDSSEINETHTTLTNIRKRLELTCKGKIRIEPRSGGGTKVTVTIPHKAPQDESDQNERIIRH